MRTQPIPIYRRRRRACAVRLREAHDGQRVPQRGTPPRVRLGLSKCRLAHPCQRGGERAHDLVKGPAVAAARAWAWAERAPRCTPVTMACESSLLRPISPESMTVMSFLAKSGSWESTWGGGWAGGGVSERAQLAHRRGPPLAAQAAGGPGRHRRRTSRASSA